MVAAELRQALDERQRAIAAEGGTDASTEPVPANLAEATRHLAEGAAPVLATRSGYLQELVFRKLVRAATQAEAVVHLMYRPGQYILAGSVLAEVWPPHAVDADSQLSPMIQRAHIVGSQRTICARWISSLPSTSSNRLR